LIEYILQQNKVKPVNKVNQLYSAAEKNWNGEYSWSTIFCSRI